MQGLLSQDCKKGAGGAFTGDSLTTAEREFFGRIRALGLTLEELVEDLLGTLEWEAGEDVPTA